MNGVSEPVPGLSLASGTATCCRPLDLLKVSEQLTQQPDPYGDLKLWLSSMLSNHHASLVRKIDDHFLVMQSALDEQLQNRQLFGRKMPEEADVGPSILSPVIPLQHQRTQAPQESVEEIGNVTRIKRPSPPPTKVPEHVPETNGGRPSQETAKQTSTAGTPSTSVDSPTNPLQQDSAGTQQEQPQTSISSNTKANIDSVDYTTAAASKVSQKRVEAKLQVSNSGRVQLGYDHSQSNFVMRMVGNSKFDIVFALLIITNALMMCFQVEFVGGQLAEGLGFSNDVAWNGAATVFNVLEHFFTVVFFVELVLRLYTYGLPFLRSKTNIIDAIIVLVTLIDAYVLTPLNANAVNFSFARLLRLLRLVKIMRIVRVMRMFRALRILVRTIGSSFTVLFWSMVLIGVIQLMAALFTAQSLQSYIDDSSNSLSMRLFCFRYYGSATRAMLSMFQVTFGGWTAIARPLIEEVAWGWAIFFILYVSCVCFAVINVVGAIFLRETLQSAANDQNESIADKLQEKIQYTNRLKEFFDQADSSGDGMVSWPEFAAVLQDPRVTALLSVLEVDFDEAEEFFNLLDDGDGKISVPEFLSGVLRIKGGAKSIDVMLLISENRRMMRHVFTLHQMIGSLMEACGVQVADKYDDFSPSFGKPPARCVMPALTPARSEIGLGVMDVRLSRPEL